MRKNQKKILIVFSDKHLAYSSTTLNLKSFLEKHHRVKIAAIKHDYFDVVNDPNIIYLKGNQILFRIFNFICNYFLFIKIYEKRLFLWGKFLIFLHLLFNRYDEYIAVDLAGWWLIDFIDAKKIHLLSLELPRPTDAFTYKPDFNKFPSIIIQNTERLNYLTGNAYKGKVFYIQNAPNAQSDTTKKEPPKNKLIFSGSVCKEFGLYQCLEFINQFPEYELTFKGNLASSVKEMIESKYSHLVNEKKIIFNREYMSETELLKFVNTFRIGFCFYDFSYPEINNYNFITAPSGKMFTYFAAGVPAIGSNIIGLNPISDFNAGKQIDSYTPLEIKKAIDEIETNYIQHSENCYKAALYFDFNKNATAFLNYISENKST